MKQIPKTSSWPLVGNALDLLFNPVNYFVDSATEHGPVFCADVMGSPMYFVVGTHGRGLFDTDKEQGCPLTREGMFPTFAKETFVDVFGLDGTEHKAVRGLLRLGLSRIIAAQFVPDMIQQTQKEVRQWKIGSEVGLLNKAGEISMRNVMLALTPTDLTELVQPVAHAGKAVMDVVMGVKPSVSLKMPKYVKNKQLMVDQIDAAIKQHRDLQFANDPRTFMIDAFIQARGKDNRSLDDIGVRGAAMYSLAGTYMYLSRSIAFVIYHLLRDRALLSRVQDEVDTVMDGDTPTAEDLRKIPLLRSCIREALRLYPPVPAISMKTLREVNVEGYTIPAGASIAFSSIPDHYNSEYFNHPFDFDPKRWFPENRRPRPSGSYGAFGIKTRSCAAVGMVEVVTMSTLVGILYESRMRLKRASYKPHLMLNPLLGPVGGMPILFDGLRDSSNRYVRPELMMDVLFESWTDEEILTPEEMDVSAIDWDSGLDIVVQGEEAEFFYVILNGTAEVITNEEKVAELQSGQSFGEIGLFKSIPRTATVRAKTKMTLLQINKETFESLTANSDLIGPELGMLLYRRYIDSTLKKSLPHMARKLREAKLQDFEVRLAPPGTVVIQQGESAEAFYVLASGLAEVSVVGQHGISKVMAQLEVGAGFGEMGLIENRPRSASVTIIGQDPAVLLEMKRERFLKLLEESPDMLQDLSCLMRKRLMNNLDLVYQS